MSKPVPIRSRLVSRILSPALQLWLRSQVEQVEGLQAQIEGGDRQILSGQIPRVSIAAQGAVYQGLHLSHLALVGQNIRINLGQVLKGKPLQLLEPVPVQGVLHLGEADLNASLQAPLLAQALQDFLLNLLGSELLAAPVATDGTASRPLPGPGVGSKGISDHPGLELQDLRMTLAADQLTLYGTLRSQQGHPTPVILRTGLRLASGQHLQLHQPQWLPSPTARRGLPLSDLDGYTLDLGTDVAFEALTVEPEQLVCRGTLWVRP